MNSGLTAIPSGANQVPPVPLPRAGSRTRSGHAADGSQPEPAHAPTRSLLALPSRASRAPSERRCEFPAPASTRDSPRVPLRRHAGGGGERRVDAVGGERVETEGLEAAGHLRPAVALLDEAPPGLLEPPALRGVPDEADHRAGEVGRVVGEERVLAR